MSKKEKNPRIGKVGGQAVLEGVMMKSGNHMSLAVRREDGSIRLKNSDKASIRSKHRILNIPLVRGCINFIEMMKLSYSTLSDSATMLGIDEIEEETKFEKWLTKKFGDNLMKIIMGIAMVLGIVLGIALFVILPNFVAKGVKSLSDGDMPSIIYNLISGTIRIIIFVAYISLVSLMKDIRRTFEYHGAEHKSVMCYEAGLPLTPENAAKCTRYHPRCGTSFIFVMLIISILIYAIIPVMDNVWLMMGIKILMLPIVVGIGFEIIMLAGKHPNTFTMILVIPGLWMQRITTKEPDEGQLEVAICALKNAMPEVFPDMTEENRAHGVIMEGEETGDDETGDDETGDDETDINDAGESDYTGSAESTDTQETVNTGEIDNNDTSEN